MLPGMSAFGGKADVIVDPSACPLMTQSGHSPTAPEARLHHQKQIRCANPLISRKAGSVIANLPKWFLYGLGLTALLAALMLFSGERVMSPESSELMEAYNTSNTLYEQGRYSEAEPYAKEALRLGTEEFGPNDPTTALLLNDLALIYQAQGRYAEAEPLYQRSLAIKEKALGPEHPDGAGSLDTYAAVLRRTARADAAERMEARAKAIRAASQ